jgi:hypothetical protein
MRAQEHMIPALSVQEIVADLEREFPHLQHQLEQCLDLTQVERTLTTLMATLMGQVLRDWREPLLSGDMSISKSRPRIWARRVTPLRRSGKRRMGVHRNLLDLTVERGMNQVENSEGVTPDDTATRLNDTDELFLRFHASRTFPGPSPTRTALMHLIPNACNPFFIEDEVRDFNCLMRTVDAHGGGGVTQGRCRLSFGAALPPASTTACGNGVVPGDGHRSGYTRLRGPVDP